MRESDVSDPTADSPVDGTEAPGLDPRAEAALSRLLRLDAATARRIRHASPARVRPRPQRGPDADYH